MNTKYRICIIVPPGYAHSHCFTEVAILLKSSFLSLGLECDITLNNPSYDRINIILGYHLISNSTIFEKCRYIPYQLEQLSDNYGVYNDKIHTLLKNAEYVWDYSLENVEFLRQKGIAARHLPIGFHENLECIPMIPDENKNIDILFYGSLNGRRLNMLNELMRDNTMALKTLFGVYGKQRDEFIARSKIILNIHCYDIKIFESVRVSYLLNNRCFIVSESSPFYCYDGVHICMVPSDKLAETCRYYLCNTAERIKMQHEAYLQFKSKFYMPCLLKRALILI